MIEVSNDIKYHAYLKTITCSQCNIASEVCKRTLSKKTIPYNHRFCPMCGEPLTDPEPLTLEELIKHVEVKDNAPLWIAGQYPYSWAFVEDIKSDLDADTDGELKRYYGDWLAYHHKPKELMI